MSESVQPGSTAVGMTRRGFLGAALAAAAGLGLPGTLQAALGPSRSAANLAFLRTQLRLVTRSEWSAISPRLWRLRAAAGYDRLTVHHAGARVNVHSSKSAVIRDLNSIAAAHIDQHYGDIAYHFVIDYTGRVWEGRSLAYEGAHVLNANQRNLGVMLLGNFERQRPSIAQLEALEQTIAALRQRFTIRQSRVYGHCDLGASACPGRYLYPYVGRFRQVG